MWNLNKMKKIILIVLMMFLFSSCSNTNNVFYKNEILTNYFYDTNNVSFDDDTPLKFNNCSMNNPFYPERFLKSIEENKEILDIYYKNPTKKNANKIIISNKNIINSFNIDYNYLLKSLNQENKNNCFKSIEFKEGFTIINSKKETYNFNNYLSDMSKINNYMKEFEKQIQVKEKILNENYKPYYEPKKINEKIDGNYIYNLCDDNVEIIKYEMNNESYPKIRYNNSNEIKICYCFKSEEMIQNYYWLNGNNYDSEINLNNDINKIYNKLLVDFNKKDAEKYLELNSKLYYTTPVINDYYNETHILENKEKHNNYENEYLNYLLHFEYLQYSYFWFNQK